MSRGRTLYAHLQMVTSPRLSIDNELYPQEASVATLCQILHRQWPDLFTITSTPRKFAECLYCNVDPLPILPVLSRLVESIYHIQYIYNHTSYMHPFIHPYINAFICSYINTFMRTQRTYIYTSSVYAWLHQSPKVLVGYIFLFQFLLIMFQVALYNYNKF